jgi:branched-chain amino acid transport system permease protein
LRRKETNAHATIEKHLRVSPPRLQAFPVLAPLALVVALTVGSSLIHSDILTRMIMRMLINLILVVAVYIFVGNAGVVSFGHMSFMALGAYTSALLTIPLIQKPFLLPQLPHFLAAAHFSFFPAAAIGGAVAASFALLIGPAILRLSGIAAGIATFSVLIIVRVVISNWDSLTRGTGSMPGVPTDATPSIALACAAVTILAAYAFQVSPTGIRLRASREDEAAAAAVGVHIVRERTLALVLSAFFTGVGGAVFAHFAGIFSPDDFYLPTTFITLAMLVVGGIGSLAGAVLGTIVLSVISESLLQLESGVGLFGLHVTAPSGLQETGLSFFLIAILIWRPAGLTGGRELRLPHRLFGRLRR